MGEIAQDIIKGRMCSLCGCYFCNVSTLKIFEHGFEVACYDCYNDLTETEKLDYKIAHTVTF